MRDEIGHAFVPFALRLPGIDRAWGLTSNFPSSLGND